MQISPALLILLLLVASSASASDFRCGSDIISTGDRESEVLRKCEGPDNVEVWGEVRIKRDFGAHFFLPGETPPGFCLPSS
jgi:hypothetical protein